MTAPQPPFDTPNGYEWRVYVELDWPLTTPDDRTLCRFVVGLRHRTCHRRAVAKYDRNRSGKGPKWYVYCEQHLYGRWLEAGRVVGWRLCRITDPEGEWFIRRAA